MSAPAQRPRFGFPRFCRGAASQLLCLLLVSLIVVPGCGGCGGDKKTLTKTELREKLAQEKKKKEEKKKPDFQMPLMRTQPNKLVGPESSYKPGHWTSATVEVVANNFDFKGELVTSPFPLDGMPFRLGTSRPALLPKGQTKHLELIFYVPPGRGGQKITTRLTPRGTNRDLILQTFPALRMPAHQFHMLVLSTEPENYTGLLDLKKMDSLRPPTDALRTVFPFYRRQMPKIEHRVPLSDNPLTWTSIAYIVWDGIDPAKLSPAQQLALVDWLHWGGQLIVSGPGSMDLLSDTFLSPYLAAKAESDISLADSDMNRLSNTWTVPGVRAKKARPLTLVEPWSGKKLVPVDAPEVEVLASIDGLQEQPLVVDRRVGLGRVVITAFRLTQKELRNWPSFDGFFNACLLRKPPRRFSLSDDEFDVTYKLAGGVSIMDPALHSRVRYYSRDATVSPQVFATEVEDKITDTGPVADEDASDEPPIDVGPDGVLYRSGMDEIVSEQAQSVSSGVAGWNDFNHTAQLARRTLKDAAGIVIPRADFVVLILGIYVLVLAPLNWLIFRLMGRVEWAWIAAPVITILCAIAVVRLAELDIGFARARTELAVVELHDGYNRAHVTRFTALYTSLATTYDLQFEDQSALVQPFPRFTRSELQKNPFTSGSSTVHYRRENRDVTLAGFDVASNSTGMLHCEHMLDVGGGIMLQRTAAGDVVMNQSKLELKGAAVIGRDETAWIGDLAPGESKPFTLRPRGKEQPHWFGEREKDDITSRTKRDDLLKLRLLMKMAENVKGLNPDELRLVAWTNSQLEGLKVSPPESQGRFANLIVAHLRYAKLPPPQRDTGSREMAEAELKNPTFDEPNPPVNDRRVPGPQIPAPPFPAPRAPGGKIPPPPDRQLPRFDDSTLPPFDDPTNESESTPENVQRPTLDFQRPTYDRTTLLFVLTPAATLEVNAMTYDLEERLLEFAARIVRFAEALPNSRAGKHVSNQVLRSGTAPMAHHGEAQAAESRNDSIHKMKVALKELRETIRWVKLAQRVPLVDKPDLADSLREENDELIRVFVASVNTAEKNRE